MRWNRAGRLFALRAARLVGLCGGLHRDGWWRRAVPTVEKANGNTSYRSILVTRCDNGIESLADAEGKVHAFADPDSTSGYAVPYYNFVAVESIEPEIYFAATPFSGSHEAGLQGVVNGQFDTASTCQNNAVDGIYKRMEAKGMIESGVVCAIWESPEITTGPWTARRNRPQEMIDELSDAMVALPEADVEAFRAHTSFDPADENPDAGFIPVTHERYQWIVDMREWLRECRRS